MTRQRTTRFVEHVRHRLRGGLIALALAAAAVLLGQGAWIHGKGWLGQHLMTHAWTTAREQHREPEPPWPGARTRPVARLFVPELKVDRLVLEGIDLPNLAWGPGMAEGPRGHRIIAGHRDTHFRFLGDLAPGQELRLVAGSGQITDWQIIERRVIDSRTTQLDFDATGPLLTLLTCYPLDGVDAGTPYRLVLAARPMASAARVSEGPPLVTPQSDPNPTEEILAWAH
jgi:sortase A